MTKIEFLKTLREKLSALPQNEVEERLGFYSEMIEDRMEEGLSEEEAVAAVDSAEELGAQIASEIPPEKEIQKAKKEKQPWKTVLLCLGSPVWVSLLLAAFAVVLALYISLWAVVISLWAVFGAVAGCALGCGLGGIVLACSGWLSQGLAAIAACLVCAGLAIFLCYGCKAATKGILQLSGKLGLWLKKCFTGKENEK